MKKLLVVDDEPFIGRFVKSILNSPEMTVTAATSAVEAIELLQKQTFDLVIVDIMMPDICGIELCIYIRSFFSEQELKLMTLSMRGISAREYLLLKELGVSLFKKKPCSPMELRREVPKLLGLQSPGPRNPDCSGSREWQKKCLKESFPSGHRSL